VKRLAQALEANKTLEVLDLSNTLTDDQPEATMWLAKALKRNKTLTTLNMSRASSHSILFF